MMSLRVEVSWNNERIIIEKDGDTSISEVAVAVNKALYRLKLRGEGKHHDDKL